MILFNEEKFNKLVEAYYAKVDAVAYDSKIWLSNSPMAVECKQILSQIAEQLEILIRERRLLDRPFEMRYSEGAGVFPRNPWVGVMCAGEEPRTGYYPILSLNADEGFSVVSCVKGSQLEANDRFYKFRNISRGADPRVSSIEERILLEDKNLTRPLTIFPRGIAIRKNDLEQALSSAIKTYLELREQKPTATDVSFDMRDVWRRIAILRSSLEQNERKQDEVLAKWEIGNENIDKLRKDFATLRQEIEDAKQEGGRVKSEALDTLKKIESDAHITVQKKVSEYIESQRAVCDDIERKFKSILERATVASLSNEFEEKRKEEETSYKTWRKCFYATLGSFALLGLVMVIWNSLDVEKPAVGTLVYLKNLPHIAMFFTPIYLPLVWFVCHANKMMHQARRLMEEYSHKAVVAKTYMGLASQSENLINKGVDVAKDTNVKLLQDTIAVLSRNPNSVLDKVRTETPLNEAIDMVTQIASAVAKK